MAGAFSPNPDNIYKVDFPLDSLARPVPEVMDRWKTENICEIAKKYPPGNLGITFDCGIADEYYLYYQNRALSDTLSMLNAKFKYEEYLGTHTSGLPIRVPLSIAYFDYLFQSDDAFYVLQEKGPAWEIFPNPATGLLRINSLNAAHDPNNEILQLIDLTGQVVLEEMLHTGSNTINIRRLTEGIYLYKIQGGNKIQTGRTLIVR
jgi:hypothetical protein